MRCGVIVLVISSALWFQATEEALIRGSASSWTWTWNAGEASLDREAEYFACVAG